VASAEKVRRIRGSVFVSYAFDFRQGDTLIYESRQTAVWAREAGASG
jgi:hypothetical protein